MRCRDLTFWSMVIAIQAYFLVHHLRLNAFAMGVFVAIGALGGIVGAAGTKRVVRWLGEGPAIWISLAFASPWFFVLAAVRPGWTTWLAAVGTAFMTAGLSVYNVVQLSFRQRITPGAMLGRMTATIRFSASTAIVFRR